MYNLFMENKIFEEIKKTIKSKFGKDVEMSTILAETGIDSLDLLDLVVETEEKHNIRITDDELLGMKTIEDIVKSISTKL